MKPWLFSGLALLPLLSPAQGLVNNGATIAVQAGALLYVASDLQNTAGSTLLNAGTLQVTGNLTNAGTLTSPGTLLFSGSADQTFAPGGASLANLTQANSGAVGSNRLFVSADLTVGTALTLTKGLVRTQGLLAGSPLYTLSLPDGGRVTGEVSGQYVQGRLAVTRTSVAAGAGPVDFTHGFVLTPGAQSLGPVTVTRTAGLQTAGVSYGQNVGGTHQGIDRVWQVVPTQALIPTAPATVTVSWLSDDDNGFNLATPAQLWRADQVGGPWTAQGQPASASARSLTASVTQLGVLTVSNTSQPLPVQLVAFAAQRQGADGLLSWTTASELNNAYFQVESSVDGTTFQPLGRVAGAGTSSQTYAYQFIDSNLARYAAPQVYYRLRQVDTGGTSAYSPVRTLPVPLAAGLRVQAYPNPSALGADLTLAISTDQAGAATLEVCDVLGQVVSGQSLVLPAGTSSWPLTGGRELAPGVYGLRLRQGSRQQTLRLVRQ